jgi:hypothetical protein
MKSAPGEGADREASCSSEPAPAYGHNPRDVHAGCGCINFSGRHQAGEPTSLASSGCNSLSAHPPLRDSAGFPW